MDVRRKINKKLWKKKNIVLCLESLQMGTMTASKLKEIDSRRRILEMSVSRLMDLRQAQDGSVTYLDLDGYSGRFLLSACNSGSIFIHDLANLTGDLRYESRVVGQCLPGDPGHSGARLETAQWYPFDTGLFTTSGGNSQLRVWDGNQLRWIEVIDVKDTINRHHMSPVPSHTSCLVAVATLSEFVYLVDLRTGNSVRELRGHMEGVNACAFSPREAHLLVTGGVDGSVLLWDVRMSRGYLREMPKDSSETSKKTPKKCLIKSVCFCSDGRSVVLVNQKGKILLWNLFNNDRSKSVREFTGTSNGKTIRIQMDVSSDLDIVFIPENRSVAVYSLKTCNIVKRLNDHYGLVNCCRFNSFSQELYSGGMDHIIVPYRAEAEISRGFTVDLERKDYDVYTGGNEMKSSWKTGLKVKPSKDSLWNDSDSD
ncbi:DNA excision repair protein ERCC-8 [Nilaparvata lugens]|uniref:DNA excision repair protein ERCC-8 n=1 Tax=Nilaparvata lugens TaxID=108931 RepID=UPI00193D28BE|nr:DNA excision repair protein ERCC-8 [Nilaparvata lugens]